MLTQQCKNWQITCNYDILLRKRSTYFNLSFFFIKLKGIYAKRVMVKNYKKIRFLIEIEMERYKFIKIVRFGKIEKWFLYK